MKKLVGELKKKRMWMYVCSASRAFSHAQPQIDKNIFFFSFAFFFSTLYEMLHNSETKTRHKAIVSCHDDSKKRKKDGKISTKE